MWGYFEKKMISTHSQEKRVATFTLCQRDTSDSGNTSNQLSHLRIHHRDVFNMIECQLEPPRKKRKLESNHIGLLEEFRCSLDSNDHHETRETGNIL